MTRQHLEPTLSQVQTLTLSAAMMLSLKVLELPTVDLAAYLHEVIDANPVVEVIDAPEPPWAKRSGARYDDEEDDLSQIPDERDTLLADDLKLQLACLGLPRRERDQVEFLIDNLDPDGYLRVPLVELAEHHRCSLHELEAALASLWSFEPAGVGARNLAECLWLQAQRRWGSEHRATRLLQRGMPPSGRWTLSWVAEALKISPAEAVAVLNDLKLLNPRPFTPQGGRAPYLVPDVLASRTKNGGLRVEVVRDHYPLLRYDPEYLRLRREMTDPAVRRFLAAAVRQAAWVERALSQRVRTLATVSQILVKAQEAYCFDGAPLVALTVKSVAAATGFHESTVRRAVWGKVLACPRGLISLAALFCEALPASESSIDAVRRVMEELIQQESPAEPLSDAQIACRLKDLGMPVSRRTVAKYRQEMNIPASWQRRRRT
ncbi:MAG: RNA polymerase factor sigma-54 [Firmicutes bacterium]|nr:RNA polymerase factor sigma-54 [Bacillota bacterium]